MCLKSMERIIMQGLADRNDMSLILSMYMVWKGSSRCRLLTRKVPIMTAAKDKSFDIFLNFSKK